MSTATVTPFPTPPIPPAGIALTAWSPALDDAYAKAQKAMPDAGARLERALQLVRTGAHAAQWGAYHYTVVKESDPAGLETLDQVQGRLYDVHAQGPMSCTCDAWLEHAKQGKGVPCPHLLATWVYRRALEQVAPAPSEVATVPPGVRQGLPASATPLPEAPASVNVRLLISGREVQWTLRDTDEARLAARLTVLLARYPVEQPPGAVVSTTVTSDQHEAPLPPLTTDHKSLSTTLQFAAERLEGRVESGKEYWKIKGGKFGKFGVVIWPEVLEAAGWRSLDARQSYDLHGWVATYTVKEDGKPDKVTQLSKGA